MEIEKVEVAVVKTGVRRLDIFGLISKETPATNKLTL